MYAHVRATGGLCIADEVQHGFGRVGSHYWGFELHGVVPDIVTVGKSFGNGHPLAAVITRPEIAAAFDNGMEYFNTFGGNPVSAAAGLAVMGVIEAGGLQAHALAMGALWREELEVLQERHALIGDLRGAGRSWALSWCRIGRPWPPPGGRRLTWWSPCAAAASFSAPTCRFTT